MDQWKVRGWVNGGDVLWHTAQVGDSKQADGDPSRPKDVGEQYREMRARFAAFIEFRDGRIVRQRNYDCFEPW
jgi:ketosteroid isomerase-like protein